MSEVGIGQSGQTFWSRPSGKVSVIGLAASGVALSALAATLLYRYGSHLPRSVQVGAVGAPLALVPVSGFLALRRLSPPPVVAEEVVVVETGDVAEIKEPPPPPTLVEQIISGDLAGADLQAVLADELYGLLYRFDEFPQEAKACVLDHIEAEYQAHKLDVNRLSPKVLRAWNARTGSDYRLRRSAEEVVALFHKSSTSSKRHRATKWLLFLLRHGESDKESLARAFASDESAAIRPKLGPYENDWKGFLPEKPVAVALAHIANLCADNPEETTSCWEWMMAQLPHSEPAPADCKPVHVAFYEACSRASLLKLLETGDRSVFGHDTVLDKVSEMLMGKIGVEFTVSAELFCSYLKLPIVRHRLYIEGKMAVFLSPIFDKAESDPEFLTCVEGFYLSNRTDDGRQVYLSDDDIMSAETNLGHSLPKVRNHLATLAYRYNDIMRTCWATTFIAKTLYKMGTRPGQREGDDFVYDDYLEGCDVAARFMAGEEVEIGREALAFLDLNNESVANQLAKNAPEYGLINSVLRTTATGCAALHRTSSRKSDRG